MGIVQSVFLFLRAFVMGRAAAALENLSLRQQLAICAGPQTVIKWHRKGFRLYWRWKSRAGKPGRPPIARKTRDLISRMSRQNSTWGTPRIVSVL